LFAPIKSNSAFRGRLLTVDALRGTAALGVVLYHAVQQTQQVIPETILRWPARVIQFLSSFGYVGVFLFFVISGFCIHLQWAKSNATGKGEEIRFAAFWKRRIRRLYPPYLIALFLYLLVDFLTTRSSFTNLFAYDIGMHLLMLHNLDPRTCYSINGVFWTLAIEEQLYLAYFLLLFLRTRWGWGITLSVCLLARLGWYFLAGILVGHTGFALPVAESAAAHWFTWALGAMSVEAFFGHLRLPAWSRNIWLGGMLIGLAVAMTLVIPSFNNLAVHDAVWLLLHPVWGMGFFIILNHAVLAEQSWLRQLRKPKLIAALASIGVISYSLYLTHELMVMQSWRFGAWHTFPMVNTLLLTVPATVGAAWLFFRFCERPYMRKTGGRLVVDSPKREETFPSSIEQAEA